jgi:plastocyanin domain-containing protein
MRGSMVWVLAAVALLAGCAAHEAVPPGAVAISVTENGFEPAVASVPRGKPVTLIVTRRTDRTCATEIVFVSTGQRHELPLGKPVRLELAVGVSDTLRYACGMDMIRGMIVAR